MTLSQNEIAKFIDRVMNEGLSIESFEQELRDQGYQDQDVVKARQDLSLALKHYALEKIEKAKKQEEYQSLGYAGVFFIAMMAAFFNVTSLVTNLILIIITAALGWFCFSKNRIAGVIAAVLFYFLFVYVANLYMSGRDSVFSIEILVIGVISAVPSFIILAFAKDQKK